MSDTVRPNGHVRGFRDHEHSCVGTAQRAQTLGCKRFSQCIIFLLLCFCSFPCYLGDPNNEAAAQKEDILALLQAALDDNRNWKAEIPVNNKLLVSIRAIPESSMAVHPFGILTFSERLVPLEIEIKKYGNKLPKTPQNLPSKSMTTISAPVRPGSSLHRPPSLR